VPADARVGAAEARLVRDGEYPGEVLRMVAGARERVWCSIFLVELDPTRDPGLAVPRLIAALASAGWRGVDARLLVGGSRTNLAIGETAVAAVAHARGLGIPARTLGRPGTRGSHAKVVVADDLVLTGSHNWSPGSFGGGQSQDSVLVRSSDLAAYACGLFLDGWRRSEGP
jgi:phosphatidylserine/phosphatidylglycerophosphate/cardiolipin synthase-like enzyme